MLALTVFHTLVSLVAIASGIGVVAGFISNTPVLRATPWFLWSVAITLITGFLFPFNGVTPAVAVGVLCVLIFIVTAYARYRTQMTGVWRLSYVIGCLLLLYFNCLVLIAQLFQKIPPLHAIAPTGNEPPVVATQAVLLVLAIVAGILIVRGTRNRSFG
ncbi:MAG: hypothetical protein E6Q76_07075 [Rhizobium sp.]|nr:MAG: hypothetical protein E6Q76_07075 [Rhizobium sp.]